MNNNLQFFVEKAKEIHEKNLKVQAEMDKMSAEEALELERDVINKVQSSDTYDENSRTAKRIKELGFQINRYEKNKPKEYYDDLVEKFYCQYGDWIFEVHYMTDSDIPGGVLGLYDPKNIKTNQAFSFYCDLFCKNTSKQRLNKLLRLFEIGYDAFIQKTYGHYMELPELLKEHGYEIESNDYKFAINDNNGFIKIQKKGSSTINNDAKKDKACYIRVYQGIRDEIFSVVTNDPKWNMSSYNHSNSLFKKHGFYFDYKSKNDLNELIKCIESFFEFLEGKYGYEENGKYYRGEEIRKLFEVLRSQIKKTNTANKNSIQHKFLDACETKGDKKQESKVVNHYKGLEIYERFVLKFNDAAQWSIGNQNDQIHVLFEYDKRKDLNHCYMKVMYRVLPNGINEYDFEVDFEKGDEYTIGIYEKYGSFLELYRELHGLIYDMCDSHQVHLDREETLL